MLINCFAPVDTYVLLCCRNYVSLTTALLFVQVNSCTGKMGKAVAEAAVSAGLQLVPVSFSAMEVPDGKIEVCDREICIHDPSESEKILPSIVKEYPDLIVVDYTVPDAVNGECICNSY